MTFTTAVKTCLGKYVTFSGRAPRAEYWWFFLFILLVSFIASLIDWTFFTSVVSVSGDAGSATMAHSSQPAQSVVGLAVVLPHLAVAWRRMHDTGRSGLYVLLPMLMIVGTALVLLFGIGLADHFSGRHSIDVLLTRATLLVFIPAMFVLIVSPLLVLWWLSRPSQPGSNTYGPNPYEVHS
ncbi:DUF805 domain-containing protein [Sedimentitalea todarodis]|uniref:DUF805 domain-containing protein n=1 Tax=Sedimentitalea todarodis TaxID=1631240 RepID=A0ABU3VI56_9RHOB|nr:DUF805 domain-containing protein [Sedimentitalea todarodis]MDU9005835.1 DUF805 domain-containing protein [Sedimentitalea todarodis]